MKYFQNGEERCIILKKNYIIDVGNATICKVDESNIESQLLTRYREILLQNIRNYVDSRSPLLHFVCSWKDIKNWIIILFRNWDDLWLSIISKIHSQNKLTNQLLFSFFFLFSIFLCSLLLELDYKKLFYVFFHNACTFFLCPSYRISPCSEFWNSFLPR